MSYDGRLISADSHVVEPADLWVTRLDRAFRDRAPRIQEVEGAGDAIVIDGLRPRPLAFEGAMADLKAQGAEIPKTQGYKYDDVRPGGWDPDARLEDQEMDGVSGELLYPGVGLTLTRAPDAEYLYACCRTYNDWLAEFCAAHPDRLKGTAMIPNRGPIEWAIAEAERGAKLGLVAVTLPAWSDDRPYNLPEWDPLWAALQDMELVASIHIGGREPFGKFKGPGAGGSIITMLRVEMAEPIMTLIWGGAPMRFPRMRWAMVESGIGWIAALLEFMDHWWTDHRGWMEPRLEEPPSHYFRRQFYATFESDRAGVLTREMLGERCLMWGSDYPHTEGVWPFSRKQVAQTFDGVPEADTRRMVHDNAVELYGFPAA